MPSSYTYRVTKPTLIRLRSMFGDNYRCSVCGKKFKLGDLVVTKQRANGHKWYHKECYESLFLDI